MSATIQTPIRNRVRVFLTGSCEGVDELRLALAAQPEIELAGSSESVSDAAAALRGTKVDVVLHATSTTAVPADELATIREHTAAPTVLVTPAEAVNGGTGALLQQALEADLADVLLLPQTTENVVFAIRKAGQGSHGRGSDGRPLGRIVTVFSPKGGTGKTVVSTNLAATLAKDGKRTLLLDLDLQFGDTTIMLGLDATKGLVDLVTAPGELDPEKLAGYVTRHPSGLDVLAAPVRPEDAELVAEPKVARLLEVARAAYDVIVVDTSPFFHGPMLSTLDTTDALLLVCGPEVPTLKNVHLGLQTLELLAYPASRIELVLNRATDKAGVSRDEIEAALGIPVAFELPADRVVPIGVNRGQPAVLAEPRSPFSKAIRELARAVAPAEVAADTKRPSGLVQKWRTR